MSPSIRQLLNQSLFQPVKDFTASPGKRIRGSLLQLSYEAAGGSGTVASNISEAIESLHAGSLIIDDIQDDSQSRRGNPTMHQVIGVPLSINAGNWLYFQALELLGAAPVPAEQRTRLLLAMIRAARVCHEGQALDLHARIDRSPLKHWHEITLSISTLKTGSLVSLAMEMGCIAADPESPCSFVFPKFGRQIGIALQMRNDLNELARIATSPNSDGIRDDDLRNARLTWPWVWALESHGSGRCHELVRQVLLSSQERHQAAGELFKLAGPTGNEVIRATVREQLRLLAEYVIDERILSQLAETLEPIEGVSTHRTTTATETTIPVQVVTQQSA